jgi:flagellar biosynthesis/type III secretory pathway chaperone
MTFAELQSLLEQIAGAVAKLRQTLETNNMDALPEALEQTRVALELINGYPEGPEKLKADINQYPEEEKQILHGLLDQASVDHQINGDLIRLAMQRSAAMQSFIAQQAPGATYGSDGEVPGAVGGVLSRKV